MAESGIRDYAKAKGFHRQTLDRWLNWQAADQDALAEIAIALKASENHLRDMMDWLEEIAVRDDQRIHAVLARPAIVSIKTDPRLGRADKLKRVKEQLRRWRFPRLAAIEESVRMKIQALRLPAGVQLSVPQGLEGGRLMVSFSAGSPGELETLSRRLSDAASSDLVGEIFSLLSGQSSETRERAT